MKRRITLSIAVALIAVLVSLTGSDSIAKAEPPERFSADTGAITLGPNQNLRISVVSVDGELGGGIYGVRFRQTSYTQDVCSDGDGVCKLAATSQTTSSPIMLTPGEAASFTCVPNSINVVRVVVESNRRNVRVQGIVFDTSTQRVVSTIQMQIQRENQ